MPLILVWMPESGAADIALDAELDAPQRMRGCAKVPGFRYITAKKGQKTAMKRSECENFPKRAMAPVAHILAPIRLGTGQHDAFGPAND